MDTVSKLAVLADAAKYDVACTSSGVNRSACRGKLGNTLSAGICHAFTADGRCVTLLKVLMTNMCVFDCAYCVNRKGNDVARVAFSPRELADLTMGLYRRNCIEGLFLSSGVLGSPDYTSELMLKSLRLLRDECGFLGYIHVKVVPGTSPGLVDELGLLSDRVSVNLELPSSESLAALCPDKSKESILSPMRRIAQGIEDDQDTQAMVRKREVSLQRRRSGKRRRSFVPAGQSTQIIIGATPESDHQILKLSSSLYGVFSMKRVFFSAYIPVVEDPRLPNNGRVQFDREHRLYQADWLMRFYGFSASEIVDEGHPFLDADIDPKANWAINHLDFFPVEVNKAPYEELLRVPGIGVKGAKLIVRTRTHRSLGEPELRKLGIAYNRARYFITCNGRYQGKGQKVSRESLRAKLASPIDGGKHGRRADRVIPGQLGLWGNYGEGTGREAFKAGPA